MLQLLKNFAITKYCFLNSFPKILVRSSILNSSNIRRVTTSCTNTNIVDPSTLEFTKRNETILKDLPKYYPSLSEFVCTDVSKCPSILSPEDFHNQYKDIKQDLSNEIVQVGGRIKKIRFSGKKMAFIQLIGGLNNTTLQIILNYRIINEHKSVAIETFHDYLHHFIKPGDYIMLKGFPGLSQREKTLSLKSIELPSFLSIRQLPLPPQLNDKAKIKTNRVVQYLINRTGDRFLPDNDIILLRSKVYRIIRDYLNDKKFIEVETPILNGNSNGANAKPFITKLNALSSDKLNNQVNLELRIAPELWLKRLIIGGYERVYELGKVFRNESVDSTHNPEFTTLETYGSFMTMEDLILLSEELFRKIIMAVNTDTSIELRNILSVNNWKFKRVEFIPTLSKELNVPLQELRERIESLESKDLEIQKNSIKYLETFLPSSNCSSSSPQQVLDKLCGEYIEKKYCNDLHPAIIYHHPKIMSPLAKNNYKDNNLTSKRFEIFIRGKEFLNAYEEENCPQEQLTKFINQQLQKTKYGDLESLKVDLFYVEAMKWGMPPTGGLGLGIDRLLMLLSGSKRIEEVLSFGTVDDVLRQ
ncbi:lysine--tRNA ligase MSK1 SCDLUD_002818 [Saccharomycodes ludwigii]|uniref:lysine--tRNA ligase MSK1 n=1 Tax=Saccharomycodes ludwigii TaxID=36035 RepID=UPI001E83484F|nr:hypothetical protein SCDLUD_002818 [Saccharomycodes ludwigii]KAH3901327.1 hypothetical protein SCDLUD_002818 [Saccharomycodes ludwigii]